MNDVKLAGNNATIEGTAEGIKTFGIREEDMGIILGILRSKMYQNPIGSICREIMSNALDAHVDAGKPDVPIEVSLPNSFSNEYRVRDYGLGMSPELIEHVFVNYGASTKRKDDSKIGGFGLGSKTGWAYGDSFTIDTVVEGIRYIYSAFIDESDRGKIFLLEKSETTDQSGTTYIVPVKHGDYDQFSRETYYYSTFFRVRPSIKGGAGSYNWPDRSIVYQGESWDIGNWSTNLYGQGQGYRYNYSNSFDPVAVVGCIPYPITPSSMGSLSSNKQQLLSSGLVLRFGIGELHLSANRESIHYDDFSKQAINSKLDKVLEELPNIITAELDSSENLWEATIKYSSSYNLVRSFVGGSIKWKGTAIHSQYRADTKKLRVQVYTKDAYTGNIKMDTRRECITPSPNSRLYVNDLATSTRKDRIITLMNEDSKKDVTVICYLNEVGEEVDFPLKELGAKNLSEVEPTVIPKIKVSKDTGDQVVVKKKPKGTVESFRFDRTKSRDSRGMYRYFHPIYVDADQGGTYVTILDGKITGGIPDNLSHDYLLGYIDRSQCTEYITKLVTELGLTELYAFKPESVSKLEGEWVTLEDSLNKYIEGIKLNNGDLLAAIATEAELYHHRVRMDELIKVRSKLPPEGLMGTYIDLSVKYKSLLDAKSNANKIQLIKSCINLELYVDEKLVSMAGNVRNRYPMLRVLLDECYRPSLYSRCGEDILSYISDRDLTYEKSLTKECPEAVISTDVHSTDVQGIIV